MAPTFQISPTGVILPAQPPQTTPSTFCTGNTAGPSYAITTPNADQPEGDTGPTPFTFTVTRTGDLCGPSVVDWKVVGLPPGVALITIYAQAGTEDFLGGVLPQGRLAFGPGETAQTLVVNVVGDTQPELPEVFSVILDSPPDGVFGQGDPWALAIIRDDDSPDFSAGPFGTGVLVTDQPNTLFASTLPAAEPGVF